VAVNTLETFDATDRGALLHAAAQQLWADICDGRAARQPERQRGECLSVIQLRTHTTHKETAT
jgi:hypothetical protein